MSTELALPASFGPLSSAFGGTQSANDELGAGVASSYAIMGFKGKVWTLRHQGVDTPLMREDGDGARGSIEVVILKASPAVSKIFYKSGYVDGSNAAPDCWSADGLKPDGSVQAKVNATCADCPMNAWGSRITEAGKSGKACSDSRRIAIVPAQDIDNDLFGGPMLLRIPAATLKDLKAYGDMLNSYQFPYFAVVTRISFDPKEAYPKFVFSAVRPLTDAEAKKVLSLRDDKRVGVVLSETVATAGVGVGQETAPVKSSPFEEDPAPAAKPLSQQAAATGPAPKPQVDAQAAAAQAQVDAQAAQAAQAQADALAAQAAALAAQAAAAQAAAMAAAAQAAAQPAAQVQSNPFGASGASATAPAPDTTTAASQAPTGAPTDGAPGDDAMSKFDAVLDSLV